MSDRDDRSDDDRVGFGRPPKWAQWRTGESGNRNGRPPKKVKKAASKPPEKLTEFENLLKDLLAEEAMLTLNGRKVAVSKKRALLLNLFKQAMSGNPVAMREVNRLTEKLEAKQEAEERAEAEAAEHAAQEITRQDKAWFEHLVELKDKQAKAWSNAAADGKAEPDEPWPHPDDVLINDAKRIARVRGPFCAKGVADWECSRRLRDHYLARYALALCDERKGEGLVALIWRMAFLKEDLQLPLRWQVTHKFEIELARYMLMPLRGLRKRVAIGAEEFERPQLGLRRSREAYRQQNMLFGPMLKVLGYRSLKHFEWECEGHGEGTSGVGEAHADMSRDRPDR